MILASSIAAAMAMAAVLTSTVPASAQHKGLACLEQCRIDLKKRGLWNAYPYGYCRNKCGYWAPAEKDRSRSTK